MSSSPTEALRRDLAALVSDGRASSDTADRVAYSRDLWPRSIIGVRAGIAAPSPPQCIVWPASTAEVARVLRFAYERRIPIVPYGAGSGVCGGIAPSSTSIVVDVKRMRTLTRVDHARLEIEADAGIIGQHLEDALAARGLTLGHFPSSIYCSTLGGWVAGRSAGQCSGRYGKIEDMVLGLECVDGTGETRVAERGKPNAPLVQLVIGSEGVLAVVTRATLRVAPAPPTRVFASALFGHMEAGLDAIRRIYQAGLRPAVARLYDPFDSMIARRGRVKKQAHAHDGSVHAPGISTRLLRAALGRPGAMNEIVHGLPERVFGGSLMVLVWEDDPIIAEAERDEATAIVRACRGRDAGEGPARRWLANRHSVSYRQSPAFSMGAFVDTMEVASPWSRLVPMFETVRAAFAKHVFVMAHFSHAYPDGASIYFTIAGAAGDDDAATRRYDAAWRDAMVAVHAAGGTLSHHHGVGRSKAPAMTREHGAALGVVRALKGVLDPRGILSPGALLPPEEALDG